MVDVRRIFHGSEVKLRVGQALVPQPSALFGGEKRLFATGEKWLAIACIPRANDQEDFTFGYVTNNLTGERHVEFVEKRPGGFDKLNACGYVYSLNPEFFFESNATGMREELVSHSPATIYEVEFIHNVRQVLQQPSRIGTNVQVVFVGYYKRDTHDDSEPTTSERDGERREMADQPNE